MFGNINVADAIMIPYFYFEYEAEAVRWDDYDAIIHNRLSMRDNVMVPDVIGIDELNVGWR